MSKYIRSDDLERVENSFKGFQDKVCLSLETLDGTGVFIEDKWERGDLGVGSTRILTEGEIFEQAGVNFSAVRGDALPPAATAKRPELVGRSFQAMGVSIVVHPKNPYVPTTHANLRFIRADKQSEEPVWWFGGGFDLTPYYGFEEDAISWHKLARAACVKYGDEVYPGSKNGATIIFTLSIEMNREASGDYFLMI